MERKNRQVQSLCCDSALCCSFSGRTVSVRLVKLQYVCLPCEPKPMYKKKKKRSKSSTQVAHNSTLLKHNIKKRNQIQSR